jgi:biotin transport system substrate-specific component
MQQRTASLTQSRLLADLGVAAGIAVATTLSAQVSVGWPIPTTLETFAVLGSAALFGARRGVGGQLLYLAMGAVGLPVFADWTGGISVLTDPTAHPSGGFLYGFVLGAFVTGIICDRFGRSFYVSVPAMLLASVALYVPGLIWLGQAIPGIAWTGRGATVLHYGLWPFVFGDLAKIFAAAAIIDPRAPWGRLTERLRMI